MWVHTKWKSYQKENACVLQEQLQTQLDWLCAILVETPHPERGSGEVCTETVGLQEVPIARTCIVCTYMYMSILRTIWFGKQGIIIATSQYYDCYWLQIFNAAYDSLISKSVTTAPKILLPYCHVLDPMLYTVPLLCTMSCMCMLR